jgi:hypothetical protein
MGNILLEKGDKLYAVLVSDLSVAKVTVISEKWGLGIRVRFENGMSFFLNPYHLFKFKKEAQEYLKGINQC